MKKILVGALAFGAAFTGSAAFAGQSEDLVARLDALEKENAAIRRENAALSENKALREKNATLKILGRAVPPGRSTGSTGRGCSGNGA